MRRPFTGFPCGCKRGIERDNCPSCEGTGRAIDFRAIHAQRKAERYAVIVTHGEGATLFAVVDTAQPDAEQPAVVRSWTTASEPQAAYLARDFCQRHNAKEMAR